MQAEVSFIRALIADGKEYVLDAPLLDELAHGVVPDNDERVPVLLAVSDNGPQMTSKATAVVMAGARIAQPFRRPGTPTEQAWVESFFGHLKGELGHLDRITDPGDLEAELARLRVFCNEVRLPEEIGSVTPEDEHTGRGEAIRAARTVGMQTAHQARVATRRQLQQDHP
jgi:putative transposase